MVFLFNCTSKQEEKLVVAVAANMQFALEEISEAFTLDTSVATEIVVGSSGKLTAQILVGAPYDIFLSADFKYPALLYSEGITRGDPKYFAQGKLVLWSLKKDVKPSLKLLSSNKVKRIAIANPDLAPYGVAAMEVLKPLEDFDTIEKKLVIGESISQVNQFVVSGAADVGFTAKSVVLSSSMEGKGSWAEVDKRLHNTITQSAIVIKRDANKNKKAQQFMDFLFSEKGREILTKFGYSVVEG